MPFIQKSLTSHLKNISGFSLIELLVAVSILGIVTMGTTSLVINMKKSQLHAEELSALNRLREEVYANLRDQNAWTNTLQDSGNDDSIGCLKDPPYDCLSKAGQTKIPIPIYKNSLGDTLVDTSSGSSKGFDRFGKPCTGHGDAVGGGNSNFLCIYSLAIYWTPTSCTTTSCFAPGVRLLAEFSRNGEEGQLKPLNLKRYNLDYFRPAHTTTDIASLRAFCASLGGTYDVANNTCTGHRVGGTPQGICTSLGGTYASRKCTFAANSPAPAPAPAPAPPPGPDEGVQRQLCRLGGGKWLNGRCKKCRRTERWAGNVCRPEENN